LQKKYNIIFLLLLLVHVALAYSYIAAREICSDEPDYMEYTKRWLHAQPEKVKPLDDSKTPMVVIAWLPRVIEQIQHKETQYNDWGRSDQLAGRYMMVLFTLLTALYVFWWSKKLLGLAWSLLPVILFLFDPLVLAHSGIIGSDVASAFVYTALLYHLWQWMQNKQPKQLLFLSLFMGLACITKQNMVFLLFLVPFLLLLQHVRSGTVKQFFSLPSLARGVFSLAVVVLVINAAYFFHGTGSSLAAYQLESNLFLQLQKIPWLAQLQLPLPQPFVKGFDMLQYHAQVGGGLANSTYNGVFVWGHQSMHHGFWFYYLATALFKMPLPILLAGGFGLVALLQHMLVKRKGLAMPYQVLLLPTLLFFLVLSFFNPFQIGIRHLIFLLPSVYLLLAVYIKKLATKKWLLYVFASWQLVSIACYTNNFMAYTNEIAVNKKNIIAWLSDSSMDYELKSSSLKKYLQQHSNVQLAPTTYTKGHFAVRALDVLHVNKQLPDSYAWLRAYKPYAHYQSTVWLYQIQ
jgi:hypothetical protein